MAEIHALPGHGPIAEKIGKPPVEKIVARLEELLALARAGDVRAFAYAYVDQRNAVFDSWVTGPDEPTGHQLIAGVLYLQHEITAEKLSAPCVAPPVRPEPT